MSQKIIKIGSSVGVTLKSDILEKSGLKLGDSVFLELNSRTGAIEIRSSKQTELAQNVASALELVKKHSSELEKLQHDD